MFFVACTVILSIIVLDDLQRTSTSVLYFKTNISVFQQLVWSFVERTTEDAAHSHPRGLIQVKRACKTDADLEQCANA